MRVVNSQVEPFNGMYRLARYTQQQWMWHIMKFDLKKIVKGLGICFCFSLFLQADNEFSGDFDFSDDMFVLDLSDIEAFETEHGFDMFRSTLSPQYLIFFLTEEEPPGSGTRVAKIKNPLINQTKAPVGRDILYLLPHKMTALERGGFALHYFFNMTNRMKFTLNDLFDSQTIDGVLDQLIALSPPESAAEISSVIPIFKKMTIQERKTGILGQFGFIKGPWMLQAHTSLLLGERNFWLSKSDQRESKEIMRRLLGEGDAFDENELFRIRVGLGDTRLKAGLNTVNAPNMQIDVGFEGIIPTSEIFNSVKLNTNVPDIIGEVVNLREAQDNALPVLRNIRDYLISPRMGNGGHFGLGCFFESKIGIFHDIAQLWMRLSYDKLLPGKEDRLIMVKQVVTPEELGAAYSASDKEAARVLNDYLEQYIFPPAFSVGVNPGGVINFVTSLSVDIRRMRCAFGYDFYAQQKERIKTLYGTRLMRDDGTPLQLSDIRIDDAVSQEIRQHKIFTEMLYKLKTTDKNSMSLGLGGDYTISSREMGRDWTLYLKFTASF